MRKLAHLVVRRPGLTLSVALLLTVLLVPAVGKLRLDTDLIDLFPERSSVARAFARFSRAFVEEQTLIVLVEGDDPARLTEFADRYAGALKRSPLAADVRHRLSAEAGRFLQDHMLLLLDEQERKLLGERLVPDAIDRQVRRLRSLLSAPGGSSLTPILTADPLELLPTLGKRLGHGLAVDTSSGYFRSADGRALIVYVRPKNSAFDIEADRALLDTAAKEAVALGAEIGLTHRTKIAVGFTGAVAYALAYRDWLHRDMTLSTLLSAVAVLLLFALFFRAVRTIPLVGLPLGFGLAWTAAAAALLYGRINAVSLAFGTILLSIGIDLPIQLYNRLREELVDRQPLDALEVTIADLGPPAITATLGPAAVFFACALSDYRGLKELGVLAGIGLILNLIAMLSVFPALLAVLPARIWCLPQPRSRGSLLERIGDVLSARPRRVLGLTLLCAIAALFCARNIEFDRRLISIQPPSMAPVEVQAELERRFGEKKDMVVALIDTPSKEDSLERADRLLEKVEALRANGRVSNYSSISALFPSKKTQADRRSRLAAMNLGQSGERLRQSLEEAGFDVEPFVPFLRQLTGPLSAIDLSQAGELDFLVRTHLHESDGHNLVATYLYPSIEHRATALDLLAHATEEVGGTLTGGPLLESVLREIVISDTIKVTIASTLAVALLLALFYRQLRPWVAVMAPLGFAWLLFGAVLAAARLPLNLFNLLAVPLVIGYGIDDHVFLVHRHLAELTASPGKTLATTGRAIILTSLSTMAGFAALTVARMSGLRALGAAGALAVGVCLIAAFAVLPALLASLWPRPR